MEASDIVSALEQRGWKASVTPRADVPDLIQVSPRGLLKCVDGRLSDQEGMDGPKALGGVYAIASLRGVNDTQGLAEIVKEVKAAGHVPSVHGDQHAEPPPMGCGYFKLWSTGKLDGVSPPGYTAEEGKKTVLEAGGVYETLQGAHAETEVLINLVPDTTFEPRTEQRFVVDAWLAERFNLDVGRYLILGAQTVELLNGPKVARIITA